MSEPQALSFKKRQLKSSQKKRPRQQQGEQTGISHKSTLQSATTAIDPVIEHSYNADRTLTNKNTNDATREAADIDGRNSAAIQGKNQQESGLLDEPPHSKPMKIMSKKGPIRAPANVRAISVIDYQPDVCKDYKQTGFCGFGDTCKFLHDRGDFKQGWQLDKDWETVVKSKNGPQDSKKLVNSELDLTEIPFKCVICKQDYKSPIITKCGHYFCESCAIQRYKKTAACAQCGTGTGGLFSGAKKLKELLHSRQQNPELHAGA
ncbi:putative CCCH and RING finger protein [Taphrina deformans PYCC 5710]|uniref:Pre-mRNA-splicing factor CWC24 n=1 Tax=Taphrina deformans (strain PYCC 5710 / ATCC 11124 / CBS 356.35 / IMI 108563 / JCM 9778 / NBRC 8474) TaxID=1097556 RepID=R4XEV0_TAPDE|nr:putative CCCH and RING finger protein [Taphrina deformans PYCC 5710]|eukprot:CCG81897.1 putative CCCH and RING finger protein [Taphrina deformans PYCC 5710]